MLLGVEMSRGGPERPDPRSGASHADVTAPLASDASSSGDDSGSGDRQRAGAGEERAVHTPVLADEVLQGLAGGGEAGWILDLTVGAGGHAAHLLEALPGARLLGTDQDPQVLAHARRRLGRFGDRVRVRRARMSTLEDVLHAEGIGRVVAILIDLGVSSLQLDSAARGFSFQEDGPLDLRMDPDRERTAADVVNRWDEGDLADLLYYEGGETRARKIARAIVESRRRAPFQRTLPLADLIENTVGRRGRTHPATRTFQALRRAVNQEGEELAQALELADRWLVDGGRLGVISFHSGEDGTVKRFLARGAEEGRWRLLTKRPLRAGRPEVLANPRSRSASLRLAERVRLEREVPARREASGAGSRPGGFSAGGRA
jgi:16S rRNA (cytosine1402-N4)-methyltransferase